MPTLSPEIDFNVTPESPVGPTDFSGVARTLGTLFDKPSGSGGSSGVAESALDAEFIRGLKKVRALDDSGKGPQARTLETTLFSRYAQHGGELGSNRVKVLVQGITGRDPDDFGNTPEEVALQEILKSEDYQKSWVASFSSHPDAAPEDRQRLALGRISRREGRTAILEDAQFNWTNEGEAAYLAEIQDKEDEIFGLLKMQGSEGGDITLEEAQNASMLFQNFRRGLTRPTGISDSDWKAVEDKFNKTQASIDYLIQFVGPGNVSAQAISNMQQAIKDLGLEDFEQNPMLVMVTDPEIMTTFSVGQARAKEILESASVSAEEKDALVNSNGTEVFESDFVGRFDGMPPDQAYKEMMAIMEGTTFAQNLGANEKIREEWGSMVTAGLVYLHQTGVKGDWMTADQYNNIFSDAFFKKLDSFKNVDPDLHSKLITQSKFALNRSAQAAQGRLSSIMAGNPAEIDHRTRELVFRREGLAGSDLTPTQQEALLQAAIREYGGDADTALTLMLRDEGSRLGSAVRNPARAAYNKLFGELDAVATRRDELVSTIFNIGSIQERLVNSSLKETATPISSPVMMSLPPKVAGDTEFLQEVSNTAEAIGADPNDLLRIMAFETGGTFNPAEPNRAGSGATGLIQFMPDIAAEQGTTTAALAGMSRTQQMVHVEKYFKRKLKGVKNPSFGDLYMSVLHPKAVGEDDSFILYRKPSTPDPKHPYTMNNGLDLNGDGTITRGEAVAMAAQRSGAYTETFSDPTNAPVVSPRPPLRPEEGVSDDQATFSSVRPRLRPDEAPVASETPSEEPVASKEASAKATEEKRKVTLADHRLGSESLTVAQKSNIRRLGGDPKEVFFFETSEEAQEAADLGEILPGEVVVLKDGSVLRVEED